jgi:hypothetical protein
MSAKLVAPVESLGVRPLQPFHARHQIGFRGFHQQMIVIAHQHLGVEAPTGLAAGLAELFEGATRTRVGEFHGFLSSAAN